jgi:hypothetical protein
MRTSVEEVTKGCGRWVARFHDRYGSVVCYAFSNKNADDAETQLVRKIAAATSVCKGVDNCEVCESYGCTAINRWI